MKKTLFILINLFVFQYLCFSQKDSLAKNTKPKMIISMAGGMTTPYWLNSDFEHDLSPNTYQEGIIAGGPSKGYYGKLDLSYSFAKHFGARASIYSSINKGNPLTQKDFPKDNSGLGGGYAYGIPIHEIKEWNITGALFGIYTETDFKNFFLDLHLSVGVQQIKSPEAKLYETASIWMMGSGIIGTYKNTVIQPSIFSYSVTGNIGANFSYAFSKKWKAKIGIEGFYSQPEFKSNQQSISEINYTNGTNTYSESFQKHHFKKNIFLTCFNVGISYVIK